MSRLLPRAIVATLVLLAMGAGNAGAAALDYGDILGTWCGSSSNPTLGNYQISRGRLTVIRLPSRTKTVLQIDRFEFSDASVSIFYFSAGYGHKAAIPGNISAQVKFAQFSSDHRSMVQLLADDGLGEYHFTRCSQ